MIKIVVDSGCDLTNDMRNRNDINLEVVPLNLSLEDKHFVDTLDLDVKQYVEEMINCPAVPKTAAPSPELFFEKFKGIESIFSVTLSGQLSSSYNSATIAKNMYLDEIGNKFIHIIDSLSASVGEMVIALKINELSKKNFSDFEILEQITSFVSGMGTHFILERYDNLIKTGRLNPYIGKIASLLNIKPICSATEEGKIKLSAQARGYKKAYAKLIDIIISEGKDFENRILGISHVGCYERAVELKNLILERVKFKDILIVEASGLCSTYADKGGLIVAY